MVNYLIRCIGKGRGASAVEVKFGERPRIGVTSTTVVAMGCAGSKDPMDQYRIQIVGDKVRVVDHDLCAAPLLSWSLILALARTVGT